MVASITMTDSSKLALLRRKTEMLELASANKDLARTNIHQLNERVMHGIAKGNSQLPSVRLETSLAVPHTQ